MFLLVSLPDAHAQAVLTVPSRGATPAPITPPALAPPSAPAAPATSSAVAPPIAAPPMAAPRVEPSPAQAYYLPSSPLWPSPSAAAPSPLPDANSPRTWVTLPKLGLDARVEAFVGSTKKDDDDPEEDAAAWRTLCHEPCGVWVRPGARLRVNGAFRVSPVFTLPAQPAVHVAVNPGRRDVRKAGIIVMSTSLVPVSAVGFYTFFYIVFSGIGRDASTAEQEAREKHDRQLVNVLKGTAVVAGVGIGVGLTLLLTNVRTTVSPRAGASASSTVGGAPRVALGKRLWLSASGLHF